MKRALACLVAIPAALLAEGAFAAPPAHPPAVAAVHAPPHAPSASVVHAPLHAAPTHAAPKATLHFTPEATRQSKPVAIKPFVAPPPEADRAALVASGKHLVERQARWMEALLPTSGFRTIEELAVATSAMGPTRARAVELLQSEDHG